MKSNIDNPEQNKIIGNKEIAQDSNAKTRFVDSVSKLTENDIVTSIKDVSSDSKSIINPKKFQPIAEKATTIITAVDTIIDPFNNYVEAKTPQPDVIPVDSGYYKQADRFADSTINDLLSEKGYIVQSDAGVIEVVSDIIDTVGSDEDEALKSPEQIKEEIDAQIEGASSDGNIVKTELCPPNPPKSILAFSSTATENYEYGIGGARQYFIPHAYELKKSGNLVKEFELYECENKTVPLSLIDENRELVEQEGGYTEDYTDEIDYLDKNTIDTDGLNMYMDSEGNIMNVQEQDFLSPLSNQEDSNGIYYPDSWKKSSIQDGDLLFQLSSNGNTFSSYFTDSKTINSCIHNGKLNFQELREKLQVAEGSDKICLTAYRCKLSSD